MPKIQENDKLIVFSIGNGDVHYADVAVPFATYNDLSQDELNEWHEDIAKTHPIQVESKI